MSLNFQVLLKMKQDHTVALGIVIYLGLSFRKDNDCSLEQFSLHVSFMGKVNQAIHISIEVHSSLKIISKLIYFAAWFCRNCKLSFFLSPEELECLCNAINQLPL